MKNFSPAKLFLLFWVVITLIIYSISWVKVEEQSNKDEIIEPAKLQTSNL